MDTFLVHLLPSLCCWNFYTVHTASGEFNWPMITDYWLSLVFIHMSFSPFCRKKRYREWNRSEEIRIENHISSISNLLCLWMLHGIHKSLTQNFISPFVHNNPSAFWYRNVRSHIHSKRSYLPLKMYPNRNQPKTMLHWNIKLCNYQCLKKPPSAFLPQHRFLLRCAKQYKKFENGAGETCRSVLSTGD